MKKTKLLIITALALVCSPAAAQERGIVRVAGDLYRAQNDAHFAVFLVTSEGIVLADPINANFSTWLKAELAERFDVPVRYVLYTHHHWDHASGGAVFADTAEFVAHEAMVEALRVPSASTPLPATAAAMDTNGNGRIERSEARANLNAQFDLHDANSDGALSGAEVVRGPLSDVYLAQNLFADRRAVTLGGKTVEMIHVGPTHALDMTVLRFPAEDAVFLVDFITSKRLPFRNLPGYDLDDLLATIEFVEQLDFSIAVGGHGAIGTKQDVTEHRQYLMELRDAVARGIEAGQSLEQLQASITMDDYSDWASFDWLGENIAGMHRILTGSD